MTLEDKKEWLIAAAQTIVMNADSIIGNEKYQGNITVRITLYNSEIPTINVDRDIYPEKIIENFK